MFIPLAQRTVTQTLSLRAEDVEMLRHIARREECSLSQVAREAFALLRVREEAAQPDSATLSRCSDR